MQSLIENEELMMIMKEESKRQQERRAYPNHEYHSTRDFLIKCVSYNKKDRFENMRELKNNLRFLNPIRDKPQNHGHFGFSKKAYEERTKELNEMLKKYNEK